MDKDNQRTWVETRARIYADIEARCLENDTRWGTGRRLSDQLWFAVLAEEFGEVADALVMSVTAPQLRSELIDLVAVGAAMIEALDENRWRSAAYTEDANVALFTLLRIASVYSDLSRKILERRDADTVRSSIAELAREVMDTLRDSYHYGYELRRIEGEDDQEQAAYEAATAPGSTISFAGTATADTSGESPRILRIVPTGEGQS